MPREPESRVETILARFKQLQKEHQNWEPTWQDIANYIHPTRQNFSQTEPGAKKTEYLYDGTAMTARENLAAAIQGNLMSPMLQWFNLRFRNDNLNTDTEATRWLENTTERMRAALAQSNFYFEAQEVIDDLTALGTGTLYIREREGYESGFGGLVCESLPLAWVFASEGHEKKVDTVYRTFQLTVAAAVRQWGLDKMGERIKQMWEDGEDQQVVEFLQAVFPRDPKSAKRKDVPMFATDLPWVSAYICLKDKHMVDEGGYHEFPFMVPRWKTKSGETYGSGPGEMALPDTKSLNKAKEIGLKVWAKVLDPPMMGEDDGITGTPKTYPGGFTPVRDTSRSLKPTYPPGMFAEMKGVNQVNVTETQEQIRRVFHDDKLQLPVGPAMTAFEVAKRFELLTRLLGPTVGRIQAELLRPVVERVYGIMSRADAFAPPPDILLQEGASIDIEYEGPLAKSQRLSELEGLERMDQLMLPAAERNTEVAEIYNDVVNTEEKIRVIADVAGVPKKLLRSKAEVQERQTARAKERAKASELAETGAEADIIQKMSQAGAVSGAPGGR